MAHFAATCTSFGKGPPMAKSMDDLKTALFSAQDGGAACDAIKALARRAQKGDAAAKRALGEYVSKGPLDHMREYACASLAGTVTEADADLAAVFQGGLSVPRVRYWSIKGYLVIAGKGAYADLTRLVQDKSVPAGDEIGRASCREGGETARGGA